MSRKNGASPTPRGDEVKTSPWKQMAAPPTKEPV